MSLRRPPPLDRPLDLREVEDGGVALLDGERLIAEGRPADLRLDAPQPVSLDAARQAAARSPWAGRHPFPDCFGCGPHRSQDEAVAIVTGPSAVGDDVFAGPWTPLSAFADDHGVVCPRFVWAALDCPTAAPAVPVGARPSVLARLTGHLLAPVRAAVPHVVMAWLLGHDGRKHRGAAAIYAPDGTVCAYSEGLWVELPDRSAMGAA